MSWNTPPSWQTTEHFAAAWQAMEEDRLTVKQFSDIINTWDEVPDNVKENWRKNAEWFKYLKNMRYKQGV